MPPSRDTLPSAEALMLHVPQWIKAAALMGAPTVISLYLTFWVTERISAQQDRSLDHDQQALGMLRAHVDDAVEMRKALYVIIEIARIQCMNAATSQSEQQACLTAGSQLYLQDFPPRIPPTLPQTQH